MSLIIITTVSCNACPAGIFCIQGTQYLLKPQNSTQPLGPDADVFQKTALQLTAANSSICGKPIHRRDSSTAHNSRREVDNRGITFVGSYALDENFFEQSNPYQR